MKKLLIIIFILFVSQVLYAKELFYKSEALGIEFKHYHNWKVSEKINKHYKQLNLVSSDKVPVIFIQKYNTKLTKKDFNRWVYLFRDSLEKQKITLVKRTILDVSPTIKTAYKESPPLYGILHSMIFKDPKKGNFNWDVAFFNGGPNEDRGFIIAFMYNKSANKKGLQLFQETLTLIK